MCMNSRPDLESVVKRLDLPMTPLANGLPPSLAANYGVIRYRQALLLAFAVIVFVAVACGSEVPQVSPTGVSQPVTEILASTATEIPPLPLPTLRPVPTSTPLPETCDPVQRAGLTHFEGSALPAPAPLLSFRRFVFLPPAWAIAEGAPVAGSLARWQCIPPDSEMPPCPSNPAVVCPTATAVIHWVSDIEAPRDHSRVNSLGSIDGQPFEILVDTDDVEFFISTVVLWTDDIRSGFNPAATKLSPQVIVADGTSLYKYPALPDLISDADYLLTVRLEFAGDNEITYLWRIPG